MAYQIAKDERPGPGLRRVAREEITRVLALIGSASPRGPVLHEIRKALKKLRALLRLAGTGAAGRDTRALATIFKNASHRTADIRDMQAQARTLEAVEKLCRHKAAQAFCNRVTAELAKKNRRAGTAQLFLQTAGSLRKAAALLKRWPADDLSWHAVRGVWKKARRKNFKRMKSALAHPDSESLHAWRKSAKTWWYQTLLLEEHLAVKPGKLIRDLKKLSDWLGDDHDLALVARMLVEKDTVAAGPVLVILEKKRLSLQKKAVILGREIRKEFSG